MWNVDEMTRAKTIVVGASAGGVEAVIELLRGLPASLNASIFIVLHIPNYSPSLLPQIFSRYSALPVAHPQHMETIETGKIYVAPPDYHLLIKDNYIELSKEAKVNNSRPSIDRLFISAAMAQKTQVIGVVLTGMLDDGSLGLSRIKHCGGIAIVQDPSEATFPQMPLNAIQATHSDYILPIPEISKLLTELAEEPLDAVLTMNEAEFNEMGKADEFASAQALKNEEIYKKGEPSVYSCPECGGVLAEINDDGILRYICRVGHGYSPGWLLATQKDNIEKALWVALRSLDESISLARNTAEKQLDDTIKQEFLEKAEEYEQQAKVIRSLLSS